MVPPLSTPSTRRLVLPLAVTVGVAFGAFLYGFSVLLTEDAAAGDFSRSLLSSVFSGAVLTGALVAIPIGRHADRHGIRGILALGGALVGGGFGLFALATRPWQVVAVWLLLIGPGSAMVLFDPAFVALQQWFDREERNRAAGTLTLLTGLAGPIFVPATTFGVQTVGWRWTAAGLGGLVALSSWLAAGVALRHAPARPTAPAADTVATPGTPGTPATPAIRATGPARMRRRPATGLPVGFLAITAAIVLSMAVLEAVQVHRIARFEATGFSPATLAFWASFASLASLPGRFLFPRLANRVPSGRLLAWATIALTPAIVLAIRGVSTIEMVGHFVVFGLLFGALIPLRTVVMGDWYGGARFGALMGIQATAIAFGRAAGPAVVGWLADGPGGYPAAMALLAGVLIAAAACVVVAQRRVST